MNTSTKRKLVTFGKVECIMRQYMETSREFVDKAEQTHSKRVPSGRRSRVDRRVKQAARRRNTTSFIPYIRRVMQSSALGNLTISQKAMQEVDELMHSVMQNISAEAGEICHQVKRKTLLAKDIQAATQLSFPPTIYEMSRQHAHQALSEFKHSRK